MEDKVTLDRESFKILASETRVAIMKSLGRRRKTLTELSKELSMSPSTVKEHMDSLCRGGLAVLIDDGHKWKYYELTGKGKDILNPGGTRILIILAVSVIGFFGVLYDMLRRGGEAGASMLASRGADSLSASETAKAAGEAALNAAPQALIPWHLPALAILAALAAACALFLACRKRSGNPKVKI